MKLNKILFNFVTVFHLCVDNYLLCEAITNKMKFFNKHPNNFHIHFLKKKRNKNNQVFLKPKINITNIEP